MFTNIAIAVFLALLAALVSGLAGHLAATRAWHKWCFWGAGGVMIILIGIQTYRNETAQQSLQSQLNRIQTNTEQPPKVEVNVPAAPKQRAIVAFSRNAPTDGIQIGHDQQRGWYVNVWIKNVGATVAKKMACVQYAERIPANDGAPTKQTLEEHWKTFTKMPAVRRPAQCGDVEPGKSFWGSTFLQMLEVDPELTSGHKVIMVMGEILYTDDAGRHKKELCSYSQPPFKPENQIWVLCEIGYNEEVY